MLDEIAKQVSERTGLSEELARTAVKLVLELLVTERLPAPLAGHLDALLAEGYALQTPAQAVSSGLMGTLGGMLK